MNSKKNQPQEKPVEKRPDEQVGFHFSSSIKITDPDTGEVLVQMRCD